jgi:hypothetical protein
VVLVPMIANRWLLWALARSLGSSQVRPSHKMRKRGCYLSYRRDVKLPSFMVHQTEHPTAILAKIQSIHLRVINTPSSSRIDTITATMPSTTLTILISAALGSFVSRGNQLFRRPLPCWSFLSVKEDQSNGNSGNMVASSSRDIEAISLIV